ncbi:MAG: DUF3667 domain-containing protein [Aureispira sp.]|nr:DUF3667 domain-containing protein [Aureispira sp.]
MQCKNCSTSFEANFCPNCGQNSNAKRIDTLSLWQELVKTFTNLEHGLFFTIKELTIRPIQTVKNYLEGKRINYFPPFKYFFLVAVFYFALISLLGYLDSSTYDFEEVYKQSYNLGRGDSGSSDSVEAIPSKTGQEIEAALEKMVPYLKYFYFAWLFTFALFLKLFFKKHKYNYAENVVALVYWMGHVLLISGIWLIIISISQQLTTADLSTVDETIGILINLGFLFLPIKFYYNSQRKVSSVGKVILAHALSFIILLLLVVLITLTTPFLDLFQ